MGNSLTNIDACCGVWWVSVCRKTRNWQSQQRGTESQRGPEVTGEGDVGSVRQWKRDDGV